LSADSDSPVLLRRPSSIGLFSGFSSISLRTGMMRAWSIMAALTQTVSAISLPSETGSLS
jgi:hypothetical protein